MDAATRVVTNYIAYAKNWLIRPDISIASGSDVSLVAVDPLNMSRYQIEVELGRPPMETSDEAEMGVWLRSRFGGDVREKGMLDLGFTPHGFKPVLVCRRCSPVCEKVCASMGVEVWLFYDIAIALRGALRRRVAASDHEGRFVQLLFYPPR